MKKIASSTRHSFAGISLVLFALVGAMLLLVGNASAQVPLPYEEHFAYTDGSALGGTGGGSTIWTNGNSLGSGGMTNRSSAALSYPGLAASSGVGVLIPAGGGSSRNKGLGFAGGTFGAGNPTVYASFLLNIQTSPTSVRQFCYMRNSTGTGTGHAALWVTPTNTLLIAKNNSSPVATASPQLSAGTHLIVLRYKWNSASSDDEVALWLDPGSLGAAENAVPGSTLSTTAGSDVTTLLNLMFLLGGSDTGVFWLDEVRVGTTWANVTPSGCAPPTQYALTGGGAYCSGGSGVSVGLANSDSGFDYQLRLNGSPVGSVVAGTGAALDFGLQTAAGTYTVAGSNTATACVGLMTGNAVVTINTAPIISAGPSNVVACAGATANFTVTATGTSLTYEWQVDTGSGFADVTTGSGGTTASYTTATLSSADNNSQYRCIVGGTCSPSATSGTATLTVSSGANVNSSPTDKTVSTSSTVTFTVSATGPSLTYQWQFSIDNGANYNPVTTGTGGTTASYTTAALALSDSGTKYKCVVTAACGSPAESTPATVTVLDATYRSTASGVWTVPATWEQSYDGGANWVPATTTPTAANTTNIAVLNGHTVTVTNALSVDDLTVASGGEVDASGATLTLNAGTPTIPSAVAGTIQVASVAGSGFTNAGSAANLTFDNGGKFVWNGATTVAIPTATWADGSTCEVQNGTTTTPTGLGQSFYDFYWNKTSSGAVNLGGTLTTVRHDLRMRGASDSASSVRFLMATGTDDLRVGNDFICEGGFTTLSGGGSGAPNVILNIYVGRNFIIRAGATLDSRTSNTGCSANILFTNTTTSQNFTNEGAITHTGSGGGCPINWKVLSGVTLNIGTGNIVMGTANNSTRDSVTVDGTLNLSASQITGPGILGITGTLGGNGTNQLTSGLNGTTYGGTLNLGTLPALVDGQFFKLFDSASYGGSFTSILPSPAPLNWNTTQLTFDGTLAATSGSIFNPNPTSIAYSVSGSTLTLSWPSDHIGWLLQSNSVDVGDTNFWFNIAGADATNQVFISIEPASPKVFFRMLKP